MAPDSEKDYDPAINEYSDNDSSAEELEDDDDELHVKREGNYEERFKAASREIKTKGRFTSENVEEFLGRYDDIISRPVAKAEDNLLHALVEGVKHTDGLEPEDVELLVRQMVGRRPNLLTHVNRDGYNPICMAVRHLQHKLVDYMISACTDVECLNSALGEKSQAGHTCLHAAFKEKENLNAGTIRMMVERASDDVLAVQDNDGKTPMHYAVSFVKCGDERAALIALFIERDLKALGNSTRQPQTFLDLRDTDGRSVYKEHKDSRKQCLERYQRLAKQRQDAEANKQRQASTARPAARSGPRDLRDKPRDPRQGGSDEATFNPGSKGDADEASDEREIQRRKKKAEEANLAKKRAGGLGGLVAEDIGQPEDAEASLRNVRGGERGVRIPSAGAEGTGDRLSVSVQQVLRADSAARREHEPAPNTPIRRRGTARFDDNPEQERDKEKKAPARPARKQGASSGPAVTLPVLMRNSDAILLKLKLHYMRTRSTEMAISFLYGNNIDDFQISFDYDGLPSRIQWNKFVNDFGADGKSHLKFDRVLQYVTFPRVEVVRRGRQVDLERDAELQSGVSRVGQLGRRDMQFFFKWLWDKGVRHIIRVTVEDSGDSGEKVHSDRAIQESLERFIVEQLDWKKTDLDPDTILRVSSKVETKNGTAPDRQLTQLYLRWSGSNAVLRGWSEPEGLPMLPHLKKIVLFKPPADKTYDNGPWIIAKIDEFRARLNANRETARARAQEQLQLETTVAGILGVSDSSGSFGPVEVVPANSDPGDERKVTSGDAPHLTTSGPVKAIKSHRWLESTARFASQMKPFWETTVKEFLNSRQNQPGRTPDGLVDDVVVALIDDGVDKMDTTHADQILLGKSFYFHNGKMRSSFTSSKGHGTVMANMILRVCPMVKIYPIRLKTYEMPEGKSPSIDAGYAAQAIQAALDKKATIISMSWTIPMPQNVSAADTPLHKVLQKAVDDGVLMFCSAPDTGKFTELDYPSGPWRKNFFRIGAARADGTVFGWTPDDEGITYVLPGVDVVREQEASSSLDAHSTQTLPKSMVEFHETGSSVATALAAGLAAMIIYCVKASNLAVKTLDQSTSGSALRLLLPDDAAKLIAHPDAMKRAFAKLGKVTNNKFVQVWDELDKVSENLKALRAADLSADVKRKYVEAFVDFGMKLWSAKQGR